MGAVLRITKAEFIKIFKKPSVYIMGLVLALILVVTSLDFTPNTQNVYLTRITGSNAIDLYNNYIASTGFENKYTYDDNYETAESVLEYYTNYTKKVENLNAAYIEFVTAINSLGTATDKPAAYGIVKIKLNNLKDEFTNAHGFETSNFYTAYTNSNHFKKYYNTDSLNLGLLNELLSITDNISHPNNNPVNFYDNYVINYLDTAGEHKLSGIAKNFLIATLDDFRVQIIANYSNYSTLFSQVSPGGSISQAIRNARYNIELLNNNMLAFYNSVVENDYVLALLKNSEIKNFKKFSNDVNDIMVDFNDALLPTEYAKHQTVIEKLNTLSFTNKLNSNVKSFNTVKLTKEFVNDLNDYYNESIINNLKTFLDNDILLLYNEAQNNPNINVQKNRNQMITYFNSYKWLSLASEDYISNKINIEITNDYSSNDIIKFNSFEDFNTYKALESITKMEYLIETDAYAPQFLSTFSFMEQSGNTTNIYDYMYYGLKISSIIIVLFAIVMASNIVAYEFDTGTIKLLAMRPFKRTKIVTGKLLAVMFFVISFILFSVAITLIGGYLSGIAFVNTPVLTIFNATTPIVFNPVILMIINIVSIIFETMFYTILALALSTMLRSFAGALTSSLLLFITSIVLNIIYSAKLWYTYMPFGNIDFFRFFGTNIAFTNNSLFTTLVNVPLLSNASIFISVIIYVVSISFVLFLSYFLFNKRDI